MSFYNFGKQSKMKTRNNRTAKRRKRFAMFRFCFVCFPVLIFTEIQVCMCVCVCVSVCVLVSYSHSFLNTFRCKCTSHFIRTVRVCVRKKEYLLISGGRFRYVWILSSFLLLSLSFHWTKTTKTNHIESNQTVSSVCIHI